MSVGPVERFVVLMTQVAAYRWVTDPSDRERREPLLLEELGLVFETEAGFQAAEVAVDLMEGHWHCVQRDPHAMAGGHPPAWAGWEERQSVLLVWAEKLQERASSADVERIGRWHSAYDHFVSMDVVLRESLVGRPWREPLPSPPGI